MNDPLNNSYYRATANRWEICAPYNGGSRFDVAVIGGGFTGLSAALACAQKGMRVGLFEAETIGHGASGRNGGQLIPGLRWSMRELDEEFGRDRSQAIFDLAYGAVNLVRGRIAEHAIDCDLKAGHLEVAHKPSHFDAMRRDADFLAEQFGWIAEVVAPQDLPRHITGGGYHGGIYDPNGGHFHPLNYALGLAQACRAAGVMIFEHSRIVPDALQAEAVILATDCWTGDVDRELGGYTVPIINYNIATTPLRDADDLLPSDAAVADSRFVLNYFRLSADKRMIFGGGEKYVQRPPSDIAAFVRHHMVGIFPSLASIPIDFAWGGAVGVTMNRLPHLGRKGRVFFAHGFSGHGALITSLAGELLAEAVVGTMGRFDIFANLPHPRFPGGRWLARPLATLGLMWYALRDRL